MKKSEQKKVVVGGSMSRDEFWAIIGKSKEISGNSGNQEWELENLLYDLTKKQLRQFDDYWLDAHQAAYRWDIWAVSAILQGGSSDSRFDHFRFWLVAQGRSVYEAVLANPERLKEFINPWQEPISGEEFAHAVWGVVINVLGEPVDDPNDDDPASFGPDEPIGTKWEAKDLPILYPDLCKTVGWGDYTDNE